MVMVTLSGPTVMGGVDNEIVGVNVVTLDDSLEDLWVVHNTFLHEVDDLILDGTTQILEVVKLASQFMLQLALLVKEIGIISILVVLETFC